MASIEGTHGTVQIQFIGIADTLTYLRKIGKDIETAAQLELAKQATFLGEEVQESIIGNRDEERSVDTGAFANSISVKAQSESEYLIEPEGISYAQFLEHGTSKLQPRRHFEHTAIRNKETVQEAIQKSVNISLRG